MATLIHFHPKDTTILTAVKVLTLLNSNKKYFTGDEIYKIFHAPIKHPNIIKLMITSQADYPFFKRAYIYQLLTQSQRKDNPVIIRTKIKGKFHYYLNPLNTLNQ